LRPEIFQLRKDGKRDFGMLCYGHPLTLKTYMEEIKAQLDPENPVDRGRTIIKGKAVTVSPVDMGSPVVASTARLCGTTTEATTERQAGYWPLSCPSWRES